MKNSPSLKNAEKLEGRGITFEGLLSRIAATPDDYKTEPEAVRGRAGQVDDRCPVDGRRSHDEWI